MQFTKRNLSNPQKEQLNKVIVDFPVSIGQRIQLNNRMNEMNRTTHTIEQSMNATHGCPSTGLTVHTPLSAWYNVSNIKYKVRTIGYIVFVLSHKSFNEFQRPGSNV